MRIKKFYSKEPGLLFVSLQVVDREDFCSKRVFTVEKDGKVEYTDEIWVEFPLTPEGQKQALQWVEEKIQEVRKHIHYWREFELPPDEIIKI